MRSNKFVKLMKSLVSSFVTGKSKDEIRIVSKMKIKLLSFFIFCHFFVIFSHFEKSEIRSVVRRMNSKLSPSHKSETELQKTNENHKRPSIRDERKAENIQYITKINKNAKFWTGGHNNSIFVCSVFDFKL